jgi:hypothetical protein
MARSQKSIFEKEGLKMSNGKLMAKFGIFLLAAFTFIAISGSQLLAAPITIKFAHGMPPDEE